MFSKLRKKNMCCVAETRQPSMMFQHFKHIYPSQLITASWVKDLGGGILGQLPLGRAIGPAALSRISPGPGQKRQEGDRHPTCHRGRVEVAEGPMTLLIQAFFGNGMGLGK